MENPFSGEGMDSIMESFNDLISKEKVTLEPLDATTVDVKGLIKDHIYGLLTKKELTPTELQLLTALCNYKG
jgi:hypothetical protein